MNFYLLATLNHSSITSLSYKLSAIFVTDPESESRLPLLMSLNLYVPRDERFSHLKMSDILAYALKSIVRFLIPEFETLCDSTPNEFDSFNDTLKLYGGGFKFPMPQVIKGISPSIFSFFLLKKQK